MELQRYARRLHLTDTDQAELSTGECAKLQQALAGRLCSIDVRFLHFTNWSEVCRLVPQEAKIGCAGLRLEGYSRISIRPKFGHTGRRGKRDGVDEARSLGGRELTSNRACAASRSGWNPQQLNSTPQAPAQLPLNCAECHARQRRPDPKLQGHDGFR